MEDVDTKRGIDLQNRFWDDIVNKGFKDKFYWKGTSINKITVFALFVIFCLNVFIVSSIISKDLTPAFSRSSSLMLIADFVEKIRIIDKSQFFLVLSLLMLFWAPINIYLFVRRIVYRHELTAFLATLLFVLPNPVSRNGVPLIYAIFQGDGAHALAFSFIPFFLLHFKAFIHGGLFALGFLSIIFASVVMIISPFAFLNLLILFLIITVSEGFLGGFRIKFIRLFFVLISSFCLSFFWYDPAVISKIIRIESMVFAISYFSKILPIFIPVVPVVGAISFLIFDRREKLQPMFISIFFFLSYLVMYIISSSLNMQGIFVPSRYSIELSFSAALFVALILGFIFDLGYRKIKESVIFKKNNKRIFLLAFISTVTMTLLLLVMIQNVISLRSELILTGIEATYSKGVGSVEREGLLSSVSSIMASGLSILTLVLLIYALKYYPTHLEQKK